MTWIDKMQEWGGANVLFLSEDGEVVKFIVVDEPQLLESKFKGKTQERIGCPIVTEEGFTLFVMGKRLARRLSKHEGKFNDVAFIIIRHGVAGDIDSTYELSMLNEPELTTKLFGIANKEYTPQLLEEAIIEVQDIMQN